MWTRFCTHARQNLRSQPVLHKARLDSDNDYNLSIEDLRSFEGDLGTWGNRSKLETVANYGFSLTRQLAYAEGKREPVAMTTRLHNYAEVRAYLEKEHPDWIRALTPRHINAPANYWPQKVSAVSSCKCGDAELRQHP
jgi:hypothetical protein